MYTVELGERTVKKKKERKKRKKEKVLLHQLKLSHVLSWFDVSSKDWLGIARSDIGPLPTQQADSSPSQEQAFNKTECCPITKATDNCPENGPQSRRTPTPKAAALFLIGNAPSGAAGPGERPISQDLAE